MKISDLIYALRTLESEHGDLECFIYGADSNEEELVGPIIIQIIEKDHPHIWNGDTRKGVFL